MKKYKLFMNLWVKSVIHSLNCENNNILAAILDFSIFSNVFMEISFHYWIKHTLIHLHAKFGEEIYTIYEVMRKKDKSYPEIGQFWGYKRCATNIKVGEGGSKIIRSTWFLGCDIRHRHGWTGLMSSVIREKVPKMKHPKI